MQLVPHLANMRLKVARKAAVRAADVSRDAKQFHHAAEQYGKVVQTWGDDFAVLVQWGNMLKDSGAFQQAEGAYGRALLLEPDDADCHLQLGHLMKLAGRLDRAEEFYKEARRIDPGQADAETELKAIEWHRTREPAPCHAVQTELPHSVDSGARVTIAHQRLMANLVWRRN